MKEKPIEFAPLRSRDEVHRDLLQARKELNLKKLEDYNNKQKQPEEA